MAPFIPGLELSRRFYHQVVRPILDDSYPVLPHAAALVGYGSDVLGFDTEMSRDHEWGPRGYIFLRDDDGPLAASIHETLRQRLPHEFLGYPVDFAATDVEPHVQRMQQASSGPVNHRIYIEPLRVWAERVLAYDLSAPLTPADWLTFPAQKLLEVTAGAVFHDGIGDLTALRARLAWYPRDVWLYLLACGWQRIGQEEHLMPRAGYVGDELGSALIGSRLARDIMSLCFLMEQRYAPYAKWFGTAFSRLACAPDLTPSLWRAQQAETWQEREAALVEAYELLAGRHNALGLTPPLPSAATHFFGRPFRVIWGSAYAEALCAQITDPEVQRMAARGLIGSVDQFSDSTDLRSNAQWRGLLRRLYL